MKKILSILCITGSPLFAAGQDTVQQTKQLIMDEGMRLYQSEMASWYGTDIFLEAYKNRSNVGGYFSYTEGAVSKCIFFSKSENPVVIGMMSFDSTYSTQTATTDLTERSFTSLEKDLYLIRTEAFQIVNNDPLFKVYKNTNLNLIPLVSGGEKKVYILTGPQDAGIVIFGNDYLLQFDDNNKCISKRQLHRNIISANYNEKTQDGAEVVGAVHTHLPETGDFITPTDICTLMLYARFTKWKQYIVVSEHYMNIWTCDSNTLAIIPRDALEKTNKKKKKEKD
ncbi:MAG: hypothetical protein ABL876_06095 [Chitinophagaceae bacterium]